MSKERLEEHTHVGISMSEYQEYEDLKKRVQELEENLEHGAKVAVETARILHQTQEQNQRYREALEEIINARNHFYPTEYVFGVEGIAREALEGDK